MLDSIFSPGQVYSQSRVFSENVSVIMVENGGRKWKRGFLAWFIPWKLFSGGCLVYNFKQQFSVFKHTYQTGPFKCVCMCFFRDYHRPITNQTVVVLLFFCHIYNYQSDVHVAYYWDELWGKESTGSESGPHGRLEQLLYFQKCLFLLICFWPSLTLACNIVL